MTIFIILTFIISLMVGIITIPNIIIISKRKRLFDEITSRKVHLQPVPRLGGLSFMPAIMFSFCVAIALRHILGYEIISDLKNSLLIELALFAAGLIAIFFVGLADDLIGVGYKRKFLVQILAAILTVGSNVYLKNLHGIFGIYEIPAWIGILLTMVIIIGIVNAFNLIDGVDGLCSGLSSISLSCLIAWFWYYGYYAYAMLGMSVMGTLIVFFLYNVNGKKRKIFMGDGGSLTLGYLIAFLGFKFICLNTSLQFPTSSISPVLFLSIVFIPVFDCLRVFSQRISQGKSPFYPDKTHIHHMILKLGYTHLQSTGIIMSSAILIIVINFSLDFLNINILLILDILIGLIFLNFLPKYIIRKQGKNIKK